MSWWLLFAPHMATGGPVCIRDPGTCQHHHGVIRRLELLADGSCRVSFSTHSIDLTPLKETPR